jgi:hypothetical protein
MLIIINKVCLYHCHYHYHSKAKIGYLLSSPTGECQYRKRDFRFSQRQDKRDFAPLYLVHFDQRLGGAYCPHHQGNVSSH